jgi:hypothetical protein
MKTLALDPKLALQEAYLLHRFWRASSIP